MRKKSKINDRLVRERTKEIIQTEHPIAHMCARVLGDTFEKLKNTNILFDEVYSALVNGLPPEKEEKET